MFLPVRAKVFQICLYIRLVECVTQVFEVSSELLFVLNQRDFKSLTISSKDISDLFTTLSRKMRFSANHWRASSCCDLWGYRFALDFPNAQSSRDARKS